MRHAGGEMRSLTALATTMGLLPGGLPSKRHADTIYWNDDDDLDDRLVTLSGEQ